jgi:hypothetical protein
MWKTNYKIWCMCTFKTHGATGFYDLKIETGTVDRWLWSVYTVLWYNTVFAVILIFRARAHFPALLNDWICMYSVFLLIWIGSADAQRVSIPAHPYLSIRCVSRSCLSKKGGQEGISFGLIIAPTKLNWMEACSNILLSKQLICAWRWRRHSCLCLFQLMRLKSVPFINRNT